MVYMTRIRTVTRKASPHPIAASRNRDLSTRILLEYSGNALRNSEVTISTIAAMASQRLISEMVRGKFMSTTFGQF